VQLAPIALFAAVACGIACGETAAPEEVALEFWTAAVQRDFRAAERYSTASDEADVADLVGSFAPNMSPAIGEALLSDERALVETVFLVGGAREPMKFSTHLVQGAGGWRVDLGATGEELRRARIAVPAARIKESLEHLETRADDASTKAAAQELRRAADEIEAAGAPVPSEP
jgi:hypothetical protein